MYSSNDSSGGGGSAPTGQDGSSSSGTPQGGWKSRKVPQNTSAAGGNAVSRTSLVAVDGRDRLYWPEGAAAPPPLPQAAGVWRNPLLEDLPADALLLRWQEPLQLLQQPDGDSSSAADDGASATPGGAGAGAAGGGGGAFVGQLLGACSEEEMLDKQQVSTANDFERLDADVPGDPEARIVNPFLAVASFRRSDAGKPFHPSSTRPAVWCRRTVHQLLTYILDADLTNPVSPPPLLLLLSASHSHAATAYKLRRTTPSTTHAAVSPLLLQLLVVSRFSRGTSCVHASIKGVPLLLLRVQKKVAEEQAAGEGGATDGGGTGGEGSEAGPQGGTFHLPAKPYIYSREGRGYSFVDVYNFFRDRLRACWQHLTVQHVEKHRAYIEVLEISCRFLIFAEEQISASPAFDAVSNQSLLTTCLDKLMQGYEAVRGFHSRRDVALLLEQLQRRRAAADPRRLQPQQQQKRLQDDALLRQPEREEEEEAEEQDTSLGGGGSGSRLHRLLWPAVLPAGSTTDTPEADGQQQQPLLEQPMRRGKCEWTLLETLAWRSAYEGEFWAYRVLCLMSSSSSEQALVGLLQRLPADLQRHPAVRLALRAFEAFRSCNMRRYILCMRSADYVAAALLNKYANYARARVLHLLLGSRLVLDQRNPMPLHRLRTLLGFDGESAKRALLQDLNSFKKVRATSYPSRFLHLPAGLSRQQLLDPDYPADAAAAAAPPASASAGWLDARAAPAAAPAPAYPRGRAFAVRESAAAAAGHADAAAAGALRRFPPSATAAALHARAPGAATAAGAASPSAETAVDRVPSGASAASRALKHKLQAAWSRARQQHAGVAAAARGRVSEEAAETGKIKPDVLPVSAAEADTTPTAAAGGGEPRGAHVSIAAAASSSHEQTVSKTVEAARHATALGQHEKQHALPSAEAVTAGFPSKSAGAAATAASARAPPGASSAAAGGAAAAAVGPFFAAAHQEADLLSKQQQQQQRTGERQQQLGALQQQIFQQGQGLSAGVVAESDIATASPVQGMTLEDAEAARARPRKEQQQQQVPSRVAATSGEVPASPLPAAAAAEDAGAVGVVQVAALLSPAAAAASSFSASRRRASAAGAAAAALAATTAAARRAAVTAQTAAAAHARIPDEQALLAPAAHAGTNALKLQRQQQTVPTPAAAAAGDTTAAGSAALRPTRRRSALPTSAEGGVPAPQQALGLHAADAADTAAPSPQARLSEKEEDEEESERTESEQTQAQFLSALKQQKDRHFWKHLIGLSNWRHTRVRHQVLKEILLSPVEGEETEAAAAAAAPPATAVPHYKGKEAVATPQKAAAAAWQEPRERAQKEQLEQHQQVSEVEQTDGQSEDGSSWTKTFPWCFYLPLQKRKTRESEAAATAAPATTTAATETTVSPPFATTDAPPCWRLPLQQDASLSLSSAANDASASAAVGAAVAPTAANLAATARARPARAVDICSLPWLPSVRLLLLRGSCGAFRENGLPDLVAAVMARQTLQQQQQQQQQHLQVRQHQQLFTRLLGQQRRVSSQQQRTRQQLQDEEEKRSWREGGLLRSSCSNGSAGERQLLDGRPLFEKQAGGDLLQRARAHQGQTLKPLGIFCKFLFVGGRGASGGEGEEVSPAVAASRRQSRRNDSDSGSRSPGGGSTPCCLSSGRWKSSNGRDKERWCAVSSSSRLLDADSGDNVSKLLLACLRESVGAGVPARNSAPSLGGQHSRGCRSRTRWRSCSGGSKRGERILEDREQMRAANQPTQLDDALLLRSGRRTLRAAQEQDAVAAAGEEQQAVVERRGLVLPSSAYTHHTVFDSTTSHRPRSSTKRIAGSCSSLLLLWQGKQVGVDFCRQNSKENNFRDGSSRGVDRGLLRQQQPDETSSGRRKEGLVPLYCCLHALPEDALWERHQADDQKNDLPQEQSQPAAVPEERSRNPMEERKTSPAAAKKPRCTRLRRAGGSRSCSNAGTPLSIAVSASSSSRTKSNSSATVEIGKNSSRTAGNGCRGGSRKTGRKRRRRDGNGEGGVFRHNLVLREVTMDTDGEQPTNLKTRRCTDEAEDEEVEEEEEEDKEADVPLRQEDVFDSATGAFVTLPALVAVSSASSECRCDFGARSEWPRAEKAAAGVAPAATVTRSGRGARAEAAANARSAAAAALAADAQNSSAAAGVVERGATQQAAVTGSPVIWWETLDTKKEMEKHQFDWWVRQAKRLLLLLLRLQARPPWCTPAPRPDKQQQRKKPQQQEETVEQQSDPLLQREGDAQQPQDDVQQQQQEDQTQQQQQQEDQTQQQQDQEQQQEGMEQQQQQQGTANGAQPQECGGQVKQQREERAACEGLEPAGAQVRILFALLVPVHAYVHLQLGGKACFASGKNYTAVDGGRRAAAEGVVIRSRREGQKSSSQAKEERGARKDGLGHSGEPVAEDLIDLEVRNEAQALVAVALRQRFMQAAADAALSVFGKASSSSIRRAAVAALAARVRFTCAAYIPVSRSLLPAAIGRPSGSGSSRQEQQQDEIAVSCVAEPAAVPAADLCGDQGVDVDKQAAAASTGGGRLPLVALGAAGLGNCRSVLVVPACCWVRRACRSLVRTALAERRVPLMERPQGPLSLEEAILCQWKLLLQRQLDVFRRSETLGTVAEENEMPQKKDESSCGDNVLLPVIFETAKDVPHEMAAVLRSWREPQQMTKLLEAAAQAVRQKIGGVHASAWQVPPTEWWALARNAAQGNEMTLELEQRVEDTKACGPYCRSSRDVSSTSSGDTYKSSGSVSSGSSGDAPINEGNGTRCTTREDICGGGRGETGEPSTCRAGKKRVVQSASHASIKAGSPKTVRDVVTGLPLLHAELDHMQSVLQDLKSRHVSDPWRQCLPSSGPDICLHMFYNRDFALHIVRTSINSLALLERVTQAAEHTSQGTSGTKRKMASRRELPTELQMSGENKEPSSPDITVVSTSPASLAALLPSTVGGKCELLVNAAVSKLYAAFCGKDMLSTNGNFRQDAAAAAASYTQSPLLCLPTSAWQLLHPVAVQPWHGHSLVVDVPYACALLRRRSGISQGKQGVTAHRETPPDLQHVQRGNQDEQHPSPLHDHQGARRHARAEGHEGHTTAEKAGISQYERRGGGHGNRTKNAQREANNQVSVTVGRQQGQWGCRQVAARVRPVDPPAPDAGWLHEGTEQQRQEHCRGSYPLLRETQDTQLALQVLASAKQCRQRAASEREAIVALLSAIRRESQLPADKRLAPNGYLRLSETLPRAPARWGT